MGYLVKVVATRHNVKQYGGKSYMRKPGLLHPKSASLSWAYTSCDCCRRFYVHLGYLVKIVATRHNVKHWRVEGEALALMRQAGFSFSLAMRGFFFFGLSVSSSSLLALKTFNFLSMSIRSI